MAAHGVPEALRLLCGLQFSVVVCDVQLSPLDGFALLDALGGGPPAVILVSSFAPASVETEAISRGATAFLRKPLKPHIPIRLLEEIGA
jgi:CheY-like chemotaxis protein